MTYKSPLAFQRWGAGTKAVAAESIAIYKLINGNKVNPVNIDRAHSYMVHHLNSKAPTREHFREYLDHLVAESAAVVNIDGKLRGLVLKPHYPHLDHTRSRTER